MYFLYLKILCLILLLLNLLKKTRKKVAFWINRRNGLRKERIKKRKKNEKGKEKHEAHGCATPIQITIRATSIFQGRVTVAHHQLMAQQSSVVRSQRPIISA